jgi:hypothetical protein
MQLLWHGFLQPIIREALLLYSIFKPFSGVRSYKGIWHLTRCWATAKQCIFSDLLKTGLKQQSTEEASYSYSTTSPLICWREEFQNRAYFLIVWRGVCNNKAPLLSCWKEAFYSTASPLVCWIKACYSNAPLLIGWRVVCNSRAPLLSRWEEVSYNSTASPLTGLREACKNSASFLLAEERFVTAEYLFWVV